MKYYFKDIKNAEQIDSYDNLNFAGDDGFNDWYWTNKQDFDWWQELANAMAFLEENEIEVDLSYINELEDYVDIAVVNGYKRNKI